MTTAHALADSGLPQPEIQERLDGLRHGIKMLTGQQIVHPVNRRLTIRTCCYL